MKNFHLEALILGLSIVVDVGGKHYPLLCENDKNYF